MSAISQGIRTDTMENKSVVDGYDDEPLQITIYTGPLNQNPGALMGNKYTGPRRKKVGKGSYQRGTTAPKTKMVTAPGRGTGPGPKKVRVADRPGKARPKSKSGSTRMNKGGMAKQKYNAGGKTYAKK